MKEEELEAPDDKNRTIRVISRTRRPYKWERGKSTKIEREDISGKCPANMETYLRLMGSDTYGGFHPGCY